MITIFQLAPQMIFGWTVCKTGSDYSGGIISDEADRHQPATQPPAVIPNEEAG